MNNEIPHEPAVQSPDSGYSSQYPTDEIDLLDIWRVLVSQRKLILIVTLLVSLLAVGYALVAPRIYKAEVFILPPLTNEVEQLNLPGINATTVDAVYAEAIKNFQSLSLRRLFFKEHNLVEYLRPKKNANGSEEQIFTERFHKLLLVHKGKKDKSAFVTVSLEGEEPTQIAAWLNEFISLVNAYTVDELVKTIVTKVQLKREAIHNNIKSLRNIAATQRKDEIARLEEKDLIARNIIVDKITTAKIKGAKAKADRLVILEENAIIADKLGFDDPAPMLMASGSGKSTPSPNIEISIANLPLYARGAQALRSEAEAIRKRKSDDPFVQELRSLERQLALLKTNKRAEVLRKRKNEDPFIGSLRDLQKKVGELEQLELTVNDIAAFLVDQPALVPENPIKPKRRLIVVLGLMLGLMLGLFGAFLANFIETNRHKIGGIPKVAS